MVLSHNPQLLCNYEEHELVKICIDNMILDYQAHLENLDIMQFFQLH